MSATPGSPTPVHFLTGLVVGQVICLVQYGISVSQSYLYMFTCERDSRILRYLVTLVFVSETVQTIILGRALLYYTVLSFANPLQLNHIDWSITAWLALMIPVITIVQGFYIHRIYRLSRGSKVLLIIGVVLLVPRVVFHIAGAAYTVLVPSWSEIERNTAAKTFIDLANGTAAVIDLYLASALVYFLYKSRSDFDQTEHTLRWIMAYTINTGLLATIISLVIVVTFATVKDSLIYAGLISIQAKLYSNCFLGALNARPSLRTKLPNNVFEVTTSYEMTRMGIARSIPRFEVFKETLAVENVDEPSSNSQSMKETSSHASMAPIDITNPMTVSSLDSKSDQL